MKENITYGECLAEVLKALDLKSSRLAREINIDSSLVYKWLRNERIPPYNSLYINLILNCLSKIITNPFQRKSIIELLSDYGFQLSDTSDTNILNSLRQILENSQGYSIKLKNKMKSERSHSSSGAAVIAGFNNNIDIKSSSNDCRRCKMAFCDNFIKNRKISDGFDNVQIVKGSLEVTDSLVALLAQAPEKPLSDDNAILITLYNDLQLQLFTRDIYHDYIKNLYDLLSNGWKCILHIMLDNNTDRTIKIIEGVQSLLATGNLSIYYYPNKTYIHAKEAELCVIPQTGALLCLPAYTSDQVDSAFLFRSKISIEILSSRYFINLNAAKPLLKPLPSQMSAEFQRAFAEYEESPGEKCVFKGGLSTITIPLNLYEKYLKLNGMTNQELSHRKFLHERRLYAFREHVKHYKIRDICFIEAIVDLVENKNYSFDEKYLVLNHTPENSDIVCHLDYFANLLETYDNYHVAFASKAQFLHMDTINWMVKTNSCVLIETLDNSCRNFPESDMNFLISEKSVVDAFHNYFNVLWDNIPDKNKDKRSTIDWLRSLIKERHQ